MLEDPFETVCSQSGDLSTGVESGRADERLAAAVQRHDRIQSSLKVLDESASQPSHHIKETMATSSGHRGLKHKRTHTSVTTQDGF